MQPLYLFKDDPEEEQQTCLGGLVGKDGKFCTKVLKHPACSCGVPRHGFAKFEAMQSHFYVIGLDGQAYCQPAINGQVLTVLQSMKMRETKRPLEEWENVALMLSRGEVPEWLVIQPRTPGEVLVEAVEEKIAVSHTEEKEERAELESNKIKCPETTQPKER